MFEIPNITFTLVIIAAFIFSKIEDLRREFKKDKEFRNIRNVAMTDSMGDYEFERFIAFLYRNEGYKTEVTPKGNDGGIDVVMEKEGRKVLVQVKHYKIGNKIGRVDLQKFVGAYSHISNEGYFVTSSSFNKNAVEYAKNIPSLTLINRADVGEMIEKLPDEGWQLDFIVPKM
jgi:restriction system protein